MVSVNGGYLHYRHKEVLVNSSLKGTTKKMARVISKTQVSELGPSWPSCCKEGPEAMNCVFTFVDGPRCYEFYLTFVGFAHFLPVEEGELSLDSLIAPFFHGNTFPLVIPPKCPVGLQNLVIFSFFNPLPNGKF